MILRFSSQYRAFSRAVRGGGHGYKEIPVTKRILK